jgi:peptide deformylase
MVQASGNKMIKPILQLKVPDIKSQTTSLRVKSSEIAHFDDELLSLVRDLVDTMNAHDIAIGLAAPQIGINKRVAVINISKDKSDPPIIIVNPREVRFSGKKDKKKESCMSVPHFRGEVERRSNIEFICEDQHGNQKQMKGSGFLARVFSHEIDHLDGALYVDKMTNLSALEPVDFFK